MDECALRIASACTKQDGFGADSISNILTMSRDKLKHDGLPLAAVNVVERLLGQLSPHSSFTKDTLLTSAEPMSKTQTADNNTGHHLQQGYTQTAGMSRVTALSLLRPYRKTVRTLYNIRTGTSKHKTSKHHHKPTKRGMGCKAMTTPQQRVIQPETKLCGDLASKLLSRADQNNADNCLAAASDGTQDASHLLRQCRGQNKAPHSLKDVIRMKVRQAGPLILKARLAVMEGRTSASPPHRALQPNFDRRASRQVHLKMRRTRQRLHRLQAKQFAAGVVAFQQQLTLQGPTASDRLQRNTDIQQWHQTTKIQVRLARETAAKERLAVLKSNDVGAYLKLVQSAKSSRLNQLLSQTDACLNNLAVRLRLKSKPKQAAGHKAATTETMDAEPQVRQDSNEISWNQLAASFQADIPEQPRLLTGGELRKYQMQGLKWMVALHQNGLNGILADEMGLGKTVQVIALIACLIENGESSEPFMIVVPSSLIANWEQEFQQWAPSLNLVAYKGTADARAALFANKMASRKAHFDVLLTSYDFLMGKHDRPRLSKLKWEYIVVDEGHRLKNAGCKLSAEIKMYSTKNRLLLTGTPVQNKLEELWALLNFLMPSLFGSSDEFQNWFAAPVRSNCMMDDNDSAESVLLGEEESLLVINRLHQVLRPFMLRRLKESVATELPPKVEKLVPCQLSAYQKALCQLAEGEVQTEEACKESQALRRINNTLMELRTICNHPLISRLHPDGAEALMAGGSLMPPEICLSGKMEVLDRMLVKLLAAGHKVLLFSTMTRVLDVLEDYLDWRGYEHLRLDGAVSSGERGDLVKRFNDPGSNINIFLLSIRAGGVGLNLQAADTVIMYDTDWNPQIDLQAQARAHRIGQKREVLVLRMQCKGTVEERVLQASSEKRSLADKSITGGFFDGKTDADARRQYLLNLLNQTHKEQSGESEQNGLSDHQVNMLIARGQSEFQLFAKMDEASNQTALSASSTKGTERLASREQVAQLIAEAQAAAVVKLPDAGKEFGRGKRRRTIFKEEE